MGRAQSRNPVIINEARKTFKSAIATDGSSIGLLQA
jgi:hypothetical protein